MKYIGFIQEHDRIAEAVSIDTLLLDADSSDERIQKVIQYLDTGIMVLAWMGYFNDCKTQEPIAPDAYFSDGEWVWPAYFIHYLKKYPGMKIDSEFLDHLERTHFEIPDREMVEKNALSIENELTTKLSHS